MEAAAVRPAHERTQVQERQPNGAQHDKVRPEVIAEALHQRRDTVLAGALRRGGFGNTLPHHIQPVGIAPRHALVQHLCEAPLRRAASQVADPGVQRSPVGAIHPVETLG